MMKSAMKHLDLYVSLGLLLFLWGGSLGIMNDGKASSSRGSHSSAGEIQHAEIQGGNPGREEAVPGGACEPFIPTREWQTIKDGQSIPAGLHVRLDMTTGSREAKLMDTDGRNENFEVSVVADASDGRASDDTAEEFPTDRQLFLKRELEEALKDIDKMDRDKGIVNQSVNGTGEAGKFRSMAEIKEDFEALNMHIRTDREILKGLIAELEAEKAKDQKVSDVSERQLAILQDIEYLVHQIDNALDFVDMSGLEYLKFFLQASSVSLSIESAHVLGSASQSNIKVQIKVLEAGFVEILVERTTDELQIAVSSEVNQKRAPSNFEALSRYVYALSAVIRGFPLAQQRFVQVAGVELFHDLFRNDLVQPKIRDKVLRLINDLLIERESSQHELIASSGLQKKREQYTATNLEKSLKASGWCSTLMESCGKFTTSVECNAVELFNSIRLLSAECSEAFSENRKDLKVLCQYLVQQRVLHNETEPDDHFTVASNACDHLSARLYSSSATGSLHTEL